MVPATSPQSTGVRRRTSRHIFARSADPFRLPNSRSRVPQTANALPQRAGLDSMLTNHASGVVHGRSLRATPRTRWEPSRLLVTGLPSKQSLT